jgi:hypothetical protein
MRPGLEEWFNQETAPLYDTTIPHYLRLRQLLQLIQAQEGVVRIQTDGSIVTPIAPDDIADAAEYLERLRQIRVPL